MTTPWKPALSIPQGIDGAKDTLVLGHSLGSNHHMWDDIVPLLAPWLNVVLYDLPGHGDSPVAKGPLTMAALLDGLGCALDEVGVDTFHIGGLSFGGLAALSAPHHLGHRIASVAIMASGPRAGTAQAWYQRIDEVRSAGLEPVVASVMERWFTPGFRQGTGRHWVERIAAIYAACEPHGYIQCCEILANTDATEWIGALSVPVLIGAGSEDPGFDRDSAQRLADNIAARHLQTPQLLIVEGARHMFATEHPHMVAGTLLDHVLTGAQYR
ncbi:alpha/beta fold hydrolase [Schaalia suimastitidis]|uniref:alpha/beta fold hydrolase n=1 Tax=Schaalia suimastitidis TaxID=121163 RepID=UPI0003F5F1ED|nr:alpha/beta fold hydrolase [Schaalia suimastitidis]